MKRRDFLKTGLAVPFVLTSRRCLSAQTTPGTLQEISGTQNLSCPVRAITQPPGSHFFGYYDRYQFDLSSRYALGARVDFDGRPPKPEDKLFLGMVDLEENDKWIELGESYALSWQMSCLFQWIPQSETDVIWNDRENGKFVSRVLNTKTKELRTLPCPIFALSPDGKWAIGADFARIDSLRPGYGYVGSDDPYFNVKAPEGIGIYRMDLQSGEVRLLVSLAELAKIPHFGEDVADNFHWVNHIALNTDGTRVAFLNRWRRRRGDRQQMSGGGYVTRMLTCSTNGGDLYVLDPSGTTSHFAWRDEKYMNIFTAPKAGMPRLFYLFEDKTENVIPVGHTKMRSNGHQTYLPHRNNEWILCDSYPDSRTRMQQLYLYHVPTDRRVDLGLFHSPREFVGEWRCDLHPRCAPDGKKIVFDSTHSGQRHMWLVDIRHIDFSG